jgi:glycosyltransferase involved in cell wall biosynthesis
MLARQLPVAHLRGERVLSSNYAAFNVPCKSNLGGMILNMLSEVRVLHITNVPWTATFFMAPIARRQAECGYRVEFASGPGEHLDKLYQLGFPVIMIPISRRLIAWSHIVAIYQLWRLMRRRRYHVVHTHTPIASLLGRIAATLARVPIVIYHMRVSWWESPDAGFLTRLSFTVSEWIAANLLKTDHIFTINSSDMNHLVTRRIVSPERVTNLHCGAGGVDAKRFDPTRVAEDQQKQLRTELGIEDTDFVVGFIGRLVRRKGIIELVTAFREVLEHIPNAKLLLIGEVSVTERDQTTFEEVKKLLLSHNNLVKRVIFTGFRDDTPNLIAIMNVLVLPSRLEPFGMVMAEAAAMARPIIATNTQGAREAVLPGKNGLIVPIGDVASLRDAILQLAADPQLRQRMGEAGRRMVLKRFDEPVVFKTIKMVYERLLREKGLVMPEPQATSAEGVNQKSWV